jgi:electron transport complex protein RnfG
MRELVRMVVTLVVISLLAGLVLAVTNKATKEPIEKARKAELESGLKKVLPPTDNNLLETTFSTNLGGREWTFYIGKYKGQYVGSAAKSYSDNGYGGRIEVIIGITTGVTIHAVSILKSNETPGLGSKVTESDFLNQFKGRRCEQDTKWISIKKDGGEIQAITGATISSRAVTEAIKKAVDAYISCRTSLENISLQEKTSP